MKKVKPTFLESLGVLGVSIPIGALLGFMTWYLLGWFAISVDDSSLLFNPLSFSIGGAVLCFVIALWYLVTGKVETED